MSSELRVDKIIPTGGVPTGGGGGIVQVVHQTRTTSFTTTNTAYQDFMSVSITPKFNTSKMLVRYGLYSSTNGDVAHTYSSMFRNDTIIGNATDAGNRTAASSVHNTATQQMTFGGSEHLDSPATTSAITYKIKVKSSNGQTVTFNRSYRDNNAGAYDGRAVSFLTVMEVSA